MPARFLPLTGLASADRLDALFDSQGVLKNIPAGQRPAQHGGRDGADPEIHRVIVAIAPCCRVVLVPGVLSGPWGGGKSA